MLSLLTIYEEGKVWINSMWSSQVALAVSEPQNHNDSLCPNNNSNKIKQQQTSESSRSVEGQPHTQQVRGGGVRQLTLKFKKMTTM